MKQQKPWSEEKLQTLEDHSQLDELRFNRISEYENETWTDTEEIFNGTLREARHSKQEDWKSTQSGQTCWSTCRKPLQTFQVMTLKTTYWKKLRKKNLRNFIVWGFSKRRWLYKKKKNWEKVKALRSRNKNAVLAYDKICSMDFIDIYFLF